MLLMIIKLTDRICNYLKRVYFYFDYWWRQFYYVIVYCSCKCIFNPLRFQNLIVTYFNIVSNMLFAAFYLVIILSIAKNSTSINEYIPGLISISLQDSLESISTIVKNNLLISSTPYDLLDTDLSKFCIFGLSPKYCSYTISYDTFSKNNWRPMYAATRKAFESYYDHWFPPYNYFVCYVNTVNSYKPLRSIIDNLVRLLPFKNKNGTNKIAKNVECVPYVYTSGKRNYSSSICILDKKNLSFLSFNYYTYQHFLF